MSRSQSKPGPLPAVAAQIEAIIAQTKDFKEAEVLARIERHVALYTQGCIEGQRCMEDEVARTLPGVCMGAEHLGIFAGFVARDSARLASALSGYVSAEYLHFRALRSRFWHQRGEKLYGVMLDKFGFAACGAIALGAEREARWLSSEFIRNLDGGYEDPYSIDTEFLTMCRSLAGWYLEGEPTRWMSEESALGMYRRLSGALTTSQSAAGLIDAVLEERTARAYRKFIRDERGPLYFYSQLFSALFPFEVMAFQRLLDKGMGATHPFANPLQTIRFEPLHLLANFAVRAEERVAKLERDVGVPA